MDYSFDIAHAKKYGVNEAIVIKNFQFWIMKNKSMNKHEHEGRTWTYNSAKAFEILFPFWNEKKIRRIIDNLIEKKVLVSGNYNKSAYDRTLWYAFFDESIFLNQEIDFPKTGNGFHESGRPIPDINTDSKPDSKPDRRISDFDESKSSSTLGSSTPGLAFSEEEKEISEERDSIKTVIPPALSDGDQAFLEFYQLYPRRVGKTAAQKKYKALIKAKVKKEDILKSLMVYKSEIEKNGTAIEFIKHPATFLGCYTDYQEDDESVQYTPVKKPRCKVCGKLLGDPEVCYNCGHWVDKEITQEEKDKWEERQKAEAKLSLDFL